MPGEKPGEKPDYTARRERWNLLNPDRSDRTVLHQRAERARANLIEDKARENDQQNRDWGGGSDWGGGDNDAQFTDVNAARQADAQARAQARERARIGYAGPVVSPVGDTRETRRNRHVDPDYTPGLGAIIHENLSKAEKPYDDAIQRDARKQEQAYIQEELAKINNPTPNAGGVPDDLDAQHDSGGWYAHSAQTRENRNQHNAFASMLHGDVAGLDDATPVNAANRAIKDQTRTPLSKRSKYELVNNQAINAAKGAALRLGVINLPDIVAKDPKAQAALALALTYRFQDKQQRRQTLEAVVELANKSDEHGRAFGRSGVYGELAVSIDDNHKTPSQMTDEELKQGIQDIKWAARVLDATSLTIGGLSKPWMVGSTIYAQVFWDAAESMQDELDARWKEED